MSLPDILQADADMADLLQTASAKLRTASEKVRALSEEYGGELRAEARLLMLAAHYGDLSESACLAEVLRLANNVGGFIDNWSDCAKPMMTDRKAVEGAISTIDRIPPDILDGLHLGPGLCVRFEQSLKEWLERIPHSRTARDDEELHDKFVAPAGKAVTEAVDALIAIVDARMAQEGAAR